jgi:UDP-N-acetylmuramoyl-tripeptide--D-alanyl-D-alanine ligase
MARLSLAEAARGTEGVLLRGDPGTTVGSYSIDTRTLKRGDLFFALAGPNHDAHRFVPEALGKGAAGVVISRGRVTDFPGDAAIIRVPDTTRALQDLGRWIRHRQAVKVIGITGSTGKTTTKEMTAAVMEEAMPTLKSRGNLNNTFGLPLCLLEMEPAHQAAVLEMGMSYPGELKLLASIADPDVGVLTNVYPVHLEHFPSLAAIADAKGELFRGMREDATAVYNADDAEATRVALLFPGRKIGFGFTERAEVRAAELRHETPGSTRFRLIGAGADLDVEIAFPGRHHVANSLAAAAAAHAAGAGPEAIRRGLARTRPLPMRGALLRLRGPVQILDETYNSNPRAMERALETLAAMPASRKIVAAGDMLELGPSEAEAHRALGENVAQSGAALFVAVGPLSRLAAESARAAGVPEVRHFHDSAAAAAWTAGAVRPGDLILVKGSRGIAMERVVEALRTSLGAEEG